MVSGHDLNRIGIFGGTFDPPHIAHLIIADDARDRLSLEKILFIPAFVPPHKAYRTLSAFHHRVAMVEAAIGNNDVFEVSTMEGHLKPPSYTVRTLSRLKKHLQNDTELYLILGTDSLTELDTWHEPRRIVSYAHLAVYPRPGYSPKPPSWIDPARIVLFDAPEMQISSTDLRGRIREGRSIRYFVPDGVLNIIIRNNLYGAPDTDTHPFEGNNGENPLHS